MSTILIKLINPGIKPDGSEFIGIYGTFTLKDTVYEINSYIIPISNIASAYTGNDVKVLSGKILVFE